MTEQEAAALAERLTRIWAPIEVIRWRLDGSGDFECDARLQYLQSRVQSVLIRHTVDLSVTFYADVSEIPSFRLNCNWQGQSTFGSLSVTDEGHVEQDTESEFAKVALTHWLPFFRRGGWLSGCPIEATAHEKAEWIQGFTQEEIEAWNLKM